MANFHMNWVPRVHQIERALLALGLTFLGVWTVAQIHRVVASHSAIVRFQEKIRSSESPTSPVDPIVGSPVDFRLWSPKRVAAYEESLTAKVDLPLAILRIPSINLEAPVFEGTDELTLNRGLGRIEGAARIGQIGNVGLAGHRDGFFRVLKDIQRGDLLELVLSEKTEQYVVEQIQIVAPDDTQVLAQTETPTLTLVTCFPFYYVGSAPKRFIVTASMKNSSHPD
jgi:sortase A